MQRAMNKRGVNVTLIFTIAIAAAVTIMALLWLAGVFDSASVTDQVDTKLATIINKCQEVGINLEQRGTYCGDFGIIETSGRDNYINCEDEHVKPYLENIDSIEKCPTDEENDPVKRQCKELQDASEDMTDIYVNSKPCPEEETTTPPVDNPNPNTLETVVDSDG